MSPREALGPADIDDVELTRLVAALLGHDAEQVTVLDSVVEPVDYHLPAITTAARHWVRGLARTPRGDEPFAMFVKHVQAWHRHPYFAAVPEEHRAAAAASVPWRTEPLAYRSDLAARLPEGLRMPRALAVMDLPDDAAALWLEEVDAPSATWDLPRYERAAFLLGRMAASVQVAPLADLGFFGSGTVDHFVFGRLRLQVVPLLLDDEIWTHPVLRATFRPPLRDRIRTAAERVDEYAAELRAFPTTASHGDASPNNLLPGPTPDSFVLIDYGFWAPKPLGFDLGQLLVGEVQLDRQSPTTLVETDATITDAYRRGLAADGLAVSHSELRRAHALQLLLFTGLSALPFDELGEPPSRLGPLATSRAALATYCLDLVAATS